jgi:hypothetical protein
MACLLFISPWSGRLPAFTVNVQPGHADTMRALATTQRRDAAMASSRTLKVSYGPKYPCVKVHVVAAYGGFYPTVAIVQAAMRRAGIPVHELSNFCAEAMEAEEDNLLQTCLRWVDVDVR